MRLPPHSVRRIALYTESQCEETSSRARAVVSGGCLQALDDPLDVGQARLDSVDPFPKALQLLGEDFGLAAVGSHDGEPDFIARASRFRGLGLTRGRS